MEYIKSGKSLREDVYGTRSFDLSGSFDEDTTVAPIATQISETQYKEQQLREQEMVLSCGAIRIQIKNTNGSLGVSIDTPTDEQRKAILPFFVNYNP